MAADNFDSVKPESVSGPWQGVLKFRVGEYRALYTYDSTSLTIVVHVVKHRREVYKLK